MEINFSVIDEKERVKIQKAEKPISENEQLTLISMFCSFIRSNEGQFSFWWKFFKSRIAPILYPHECQSLELLNKLDDFGFRQPFNCPHQIHQLVLSMLLDCLETPKKASVLYETDKDIYLMLLIFRQSFLFPPQYFEYAQKMLKVYRSWICKDNFLYSFPEIMEKSRNIYFRVFIDNLLQTFFMKGDEENLDIHIAMSHEVLEIFLFFTQVPDRVETETWSTLLIAHLEIFEHLITRKQSQLKYDQDYGTMLTNIVIRNLFILWIKSNPLEDELWNQLNEVLNVHFQEECMSDFWYKTIINLTKALLSKIYFVPEELIGNFATYDIEKYMLEKKKGKIKVSTKKFGSSIREYLVKQDKKVLLHLFHRFTSMYGSKSETLPGKLHSKKVKTISDSIFLFLNISYQEVKVPKGTIPPPFIHSAEGNKLLQLYGEWLFEATERTDNLFYDGRALAYKTLCSIFSQKFSQPWNKTFLSHFYRAIHLGFTTKTTIEIRDTIILNSTDFFSLQLPGSNLLIPDYVKACEQMLKTKTSARELRLSGLNILISIIHLCYLFGDVELLNIDTVKFEEEKKDGKEETKEDTTYHNFVSIRDKIVKIFFSCVGDDTHEPCQIKSLWGLFLILHKELNQNLTNNIPKQVETKPIIDCISAFVMDKNIQLAAASHDVINSICHLGLLNSLPNNLIIRILNQSCSAIIGHLTEGQNLKAELLMNLYQTISEVISIAPSEVITNVAVMDDIFTSIALGLSKEKIAKALGQVISQTPKLEPQPVDLKKQSLKTQSMIIPSTPRQESIQKDYAKEIYEAALSLLNFITNTLNQFPNPNGPTNVSSNTSEFEYLTEKQGVTIPSQKILHYAFNGSSLLTIMEKPNDTKTARFICRDMTGRNVWDFQLVFRMDDHLFNFKDGLEKPKKKKLLVEVGGINDEKLVTPILEKENKVDNPELKEIKEDQTPDLPNDPIPELPKEQVPDLPNDLPPEIPNDLPTEIPNDLPPEIPNDLPPELPNDLPPEIPEKNDEYPKFEKDIDTDKTDMLDILQNYIQTVFPETEEFRKGVVTEIKEQKIDISEEDSITKKITNNEKIILSETPIVKFPQCTNPVEEKNEHPIFRAFRTFMNTMGFTRLGNQQSFFRLQVDPKFYKNLKQLDKLSERESIKVGVLYVANGQESGNDIFKNDKASDLFYEFTESLGWPINPSTHTGYLGGIDPTNIQKIPYFSNSTTEVIFHVAPYIISPKEDPQNLYRKRYLGNDFVHIIWSEHDRDYRPWTILSSVITYHIVIYPIKNSGLFRIQIFIKPGFPMVGPLINGCIVDKLSLGPLVRMTAINANKAVKQKLKLAKRPYTIRKDFIEEVINKFKPQKSEEYKDFLKPLFLFIEKEEEPTIDLSKEISGNEKEPLAFDNSWEPEDETKCKQYEEKKKEEKDSLEFEIE